MRQISSSSVKQILYTKYLIYLLGKNLFAAYYVHNIMYETMRDSKEINIYLTVSHGKLLAWVD